MRPNPYSMSLGGHPCHPALDLSRVTSTDMDGILMIAVQALERRTVELKEKEAKIMALESRLEALEKLVWELKQASSVAALPPSTK